MLVEYKKKWFNPELVESIKVHMSGSTVMQNRIYKRQLYISIYISGNSQMAIPIEVYCDNETIDKCRNLEYMHGLAEEDLKKLATFINRHCKETKCKN
jgi:hypothetical protein